MKFKCSKCGEEHDGWPALAFDSPFYYHGLSEKDKAEIGERDENFCVIRHGDQTDRFIRVVLHQKVIGACQTLDYGVWVSVSERTFDDYKAKFDDGDHEGGFFGYLCNNIPGYESTLSIKANVIVSKGKNRPEIIPHDDQMDVEFVRDYYKGISLDVAEIKIATAMDGFTQRI